MKKFLTLFTAFCFTLSVFAETEFTFASNEDVTQTKNGITVTLAKGSNTQAPVYSSYNGMKLYANNTITINAEQVFQNVQIVFAKNENKTYAALSASPSGITSDETSTALDDKKVVKWTGNTSHLVFTLGSSGQRVIFRMVIDGEPIVIVPEGYVDDSPLEEDYLYGEPTTIFAPDKLFSKKEYAFISSNIRVHCTQGSIVDTASTPYFNVNAGYTLTFEASKPMKGLAISGMVRKQFDAMVDHGTINFCSPGELEDDHEGNPVVIIKDINEKSVTITCPKQVRCYAVRVYFDANPTEELDCGGSSSGGETYFLEFDRADAIYESEISKDEGKPNYTIYLMNKANPDYPYITLDLYPAAKGDLTGSYEMDNGSLGETTWYQYGESALDKTWMYEDGMVVINKEGNVYSISGFLTCDDTNTYNFSFSGEMPFYTDTEYYPEGLHDIHGTNSATKILRNGQLIIIRNSKQYNVLGAQL